MTKKNETKNETKNVKNEVKKNEAAEGTITEVVNPSSPTLDDIKAKKEALRQELAKLREDEKAAKSQRKRGPSLQSIAEEKQKANPTLSKEELTRALINEHPDKACITIVSVVRKLKFSKE